MFLEILPELLKTNIDSLKIEGRMKSPEYVATVTRIYRKYLDKIMNNEDYIIYEQDKKDLVQVFNRGNFSTGHLKDTTNRNLIFKEKPNNMGIYLGTVSNYNANKGHITLTLNDTISVGDTINFEKEQTTYRVSELMINNKNITNCKVSDKVTIGRMKGNINIGDKIYKLSSKDLCEKAIYSYSSENKKLALNCVLNLHLDEPIKLRVFDNNGLEVTLCSDETPDVAISSPISKERLEKQLNKTGNTPFFFKNIKINMDNNLYIPHISKINELRRLALEKYSTLIVNKSKRKITLEINKCGKSSFIHNDNQICMLLNKLDLNFDYSKLNNIDKLYIPLKYFSMKDYTSILNTLSNSFSLYIYMPTIIKTNYRNLFRNVIERCLSTYNIKGFVISNIGQFELLKEYKEKYEFIANYTLNIFNNATIENLNCDTFTISPELNKDEINDISNQTNSKTELIVYGRIPLMTSGYCLLGESNKCYPDCKQKCKTDNKFYLKDRMNFKFRVIPDNI